MRGDEQRISRKGADPKAFSSEVFQISNLDLRFSV
jgi:hypothetical protein